MQVGQYCMVTGNNHHHTNTLSSDKANYRQDVLLYIAVENLFMQGLLLNDHITILQCLKIVILGAASTADTQWYNSDIGGLLAYNSEALSCVEAT